MKDRIASHVARVLPRITEIRHEIHSNPELALHERDTAGLVRRTLDGAGLVVCEPFIGNDVVALLGEQALPNVTLRADMDALPLQEKTGLSYASQRPGWMHACGHDGHTAILLGTALVLSQVADELSGSVRFVFQPGEEIVAAGKDLVEAGALKDPKPSMVLALHSWPNHPVGAIGAAPGATCASADMFKIVIRGRGAHGSMPQDSIDPIVTGARIVDALQSIVSRETPAHIPLVISVCRFDSGSNSNVIPDSAELEGTVRYYDQEIGERAHRRIEETVRGICVAMGASYEFDYKSPYIPLFNDSNVVDFGRAVVRAVLGEQC